MTKTSCPKLLDDVDIENIGPSNPLNDVLAMAKAPHGDEVPMPTLPLFATRKFVRADEPTANAGAAAMPVMSTDSCAHGEVVPIPTAPVEPIINAGMVEVAKVDGDEVAMYKFPLIERNVQGLLVSEPSASVS